MRSTLAAATSAQTDGWDMCSETLSKSLTKELTLSNFKKESHLEAFTAKTFETLNITKSMLDRQNFKISKFQTFRLMLNLICTLMGPF